MNYLGSILSLLPLAGVLVWGYRLEVPLIYIICTASAGATFAATFFFERRHMRGEETETPIGKWREDQPDFRRVDCKAA